VRDGAADQIGPPGPRQLIPAALSPDQAGAILDQEASRDCARVTGYPSVTTNALPYTSTALRPYGLLAVNAFRFARDPGGTRMGVVLPSNPVAWE
jgi:hypothetical protein